MRGRSSRAWPVLVVMAIAASCAAGRRETSGEGVEPLTVTSLVSVRDRFRITPPATRERAERAPFSVIGEGVATGFEPSDASGSLRAVFPPGVKRQVSRSASVELPIKANAMVRLEDDTTHLSVSFALRDANDAPIAVDRGIALYPKALAGSDVVHRVTAEGTEDFVVFEAQPAREEIVYDVDVSHVAGLRLVSNTLEFLDETGAPRLRVAPPYVVDTKGARSEATLAVEGCSYDMNASGPWGRAITRAGASHCTLRVAWQSAVYPLIVDPSWVATGSMMYAREYHTATLLGTQMVLVAGGAGSGFPKVAELYNPAKGMFAVTGPLIAARYEHTATLLNSGMVLVAGGDGAGGILGTAELYNPTTGMFTTTGPLMTAREEHTATLLPSGKVLVAGGYTTGGVTVVASAELYDGSTAFTFTGPMTIPRVNHTATLLPSSGKVLIAGGESNTGILLSAELYDGSTTFTLTGPMSAARYSHTATLLPSSGKVLVAGGDMTGTADLFDGTATFTATGPMTQPRRYHTATLLDSGKVVLAGGGGPLLTAELYDGSTSFALTGPMTVARSEHTATRLPSGQVLVAGGMGLGATPLLSAELFALSLGAPCVVADDCGSGICNEKCCSAACAGTCMTCDATGACDVVKSADDPNTCTPALNQSSCDATGLCKKIQGQLCMAATDCDSGFCSDGVCCNSACGGACDVCAMSLGASADGVCTIAAVGFAGSPSCGMGFACDGMSGTCPVSCVADNECLATEYCSANGTCQPQKMQSTSCNQAAGADCFGAGCRDCATGNCVDGFCCNSACNTLCQACAAALKQSGADDGTCDSAKAQTNPHKDFCPVDPQSSCGHDGLCSGAGACSLYYPLGTSCGASACGMGNNVSGDLCNGSGVCAPNPNAVSCGNFACVNDSCLATCTTDADCISTAYCKQGTCLPREMNGLGCTSGDECTSTFCADGVCCNSACTGQCEACSIKATNGTCTAVAGDPAPGHSACATGSASEPCSAAKCDGMNRTSCAAFVDENVTCRAATCKDGIETSTAGCDGKGSCPAVNQKECEPFACATDACKTTCSADTDCAAPNICDEMTHQCIATSVCDGEHTITPPTGTPHDCTPFKCTPQGACLTQCNAATDCVAPSACNADHQCVLPPAPDSQADGSCQLQHAQSGAGDSSSRAWFFGLVCALFALRKRRAEERA